MGRPQISITGLICAIAVCALTFSGLRNPTVFWAGCIFTASLLILLWATLMALRGPEPARTFWMGFALFGCTHAALTIGWNHERVPEPLLPTAYLLHVFYLRTHNLSHFYDKIMVPNMWSERIVYFCRIGNSLIALVFGMAGGLAATWIASRNRPVVPSETRPEA